MLNTYFPIFTEVHRNLPTEVTLSCKDGKNFEAHRALLAARSQYFYGIKGSYLEKILKYIYRHQPGINHGINQVQLEPTGKKCYFQYGYKWSVDCFLEFD